MILNDIQIQNRCDGKSPLISPYHVDLLNAHSYDCTLDNKFKRARLKVSDHNPTITAHLWDEYEKDSFTVLPGQFVLASTIEYFRLPRSVVGFVQGKSSIGRSGLNVQNAGLIDSSFFGNITLELFNMAPWPITLKAGQRICQVYFTLNDESTFRHYDKIGHYNGQTGPTLSRF
jgi:dCTP deaminase